MATVQLNDHASQTSFRKSQLIVYPTYGFCRIAAVEQADVRDGLEDCYVFQMGSATNPIKVLMPVAQAEKAGLRRPITKQEADAVLEVFEMAATPLEPRTKEQLDEVSARLSSNDLLQVAATIRDLAAAGVKAGDGQSDAACVNHRRSEQAMLSQALGRLIEEIAYAQRVPHKQVEGHVRKCLERTRRAHATPVQER